MISLLGDSVIEWGALLDVVWTSMAGGIGVTAAFSLALLGATRAVDLRRDGRVAAAAAYAVLLALAGATVVAAVAFGVIVMTSKG